jgi:hypothetical protein
MKIDKLVHYIWVGTAEVPAHFMLNYEHTKNLNKDYLFKIWTESDILPVLGDYTERFMTSSLYHKLQLAKYMISHTFGGVYSDFDIEWKVPFDHITDMFQNVDVVLPKRKSLYFFNKGQKTIMVDDFVIMSSPNIMKSFLDFCLVRTERKDDRAEPFSVYALTEWCLGQSNVGFLTPDQIYDTPDCTLGYHYNKRTW